MARQFHTIETTSALHENVIAIWSSESRPPHSITPDLLLPDGYIEILFVLSGSYKRRKMGLGQGQVIIDRSVIIGIQNNPVMSQNVGVQKSIGIQFDPMQFYLLFGDLGVKSCNTHTPITESGQEELMLLNKEIFKSATITEALQEVEDFFVKYIPKHNRCVIWQSTQDYLKDLWHSKGITSKESRVKPSTLNAKLLRINLKKFIGLDLDEMRAIIKATSAETAFPINDPSSFLSIKNLLGDSDENQENKLF